jgi:transposase
LLFFYFSKKKGKDMQYSTDLTDEEWALIKDEFPVRQGAGRPPKTNYRSVVNAIVYVAKTGCQWNMLPKGYPPKSTVHYYFTKWQYSETWQKIHGKLLKKVRKAAGRKKPPTAAIIDAQSVKSAIKGGSNRAIASGTMLEKRSRDANGIAA